MVYYKALIAAADANGVSDMIAPVVARLEYLIALAEQQQAAAPNLFAQSLAAPPPTDARTATPDRADRADA